MYRDYSKRILAHTHTHARTHARTQRQNSKNLGKTQRENVYEREKLNGGAVRHAYTGRRCLGH